MKSTETHWTHTGVTRKDILTSVGASGAKMMYPVVVPEGTICHKLDGGINPWVVSDLRFIQDKNSLLYSTADIYGIRIEESMVVDQKEVIGHSNSESTHPRQR